jgi:hypothetical protein
MNTKIRLACMSALILAAGLSACNSNNSDKKIPADTQGTSAPKADLKLPDGFSATIVANSLGHLRHMAINANGDVYVNFSSLQDGKGIYMLKDTDRDGLLDKITAFAGYPGTGITIHNGYLYSASNTGVFRYKLDDKGEVIDTGKAEEIVQGLVEQIIQNPLSLTIKIICM